MKNNKSHKYLFTMRKSPVIAMITIVISVSWVIIKEIICWIVGIKITHFITTIILQKILAVHATIVIGTFD